MGIFSEFPLNFVSNNVLNVSVHLATFHHFYPNSVEKNVYHAISSEEMSYQRQRSTND